MGHTLTLHTTNPNVVPIHYGAYRFHSLHRRSARRQQATRHVLPPLPQSLHNAVV
jgi:hypothetical protein